eukprot:4541325-Pyramimonas_sp.AAC.1
MEGLRLVDGGGIFVWRDCDWSTGNVYSFLLPEIARLVGGCTTLPYIYYLRTSTMYAHLLRALIHKGHP